MSDELRELLERARVEEVVTRLFLNTDKRDWAGVKACFAPTVLFDMSSAGGGRAGSVTPEHIAAGWETGLRPLEHIHHQAGNFVTKVSGDEATVCCYGIAYHHKRTQSGRNTRTFVGSYDVSLRRGRDGVWTIHAFRFNLKFIDGNLELEKG
ncbi:MAG TPA: nuclear transport factor 2 family protein [Polyangia bacterium]